MKIYSLKDRFSYKLTYHFWNMFNALEFEFSTNSIYYAPLIRDKAFFHFCYSYGLSPSEAIKLSIFDLNFKDDDMENGIYGSVYIEYQNINDSRIVYPLFSESIRDVNKYIKVFNNYFGNNNNKHLFVSNKGNILTINYLKKRLRYYNSKLSYSKQIDSIYSFRQFYIADLLRLKNLSQDFINNQIGNSMINNQIYLYLYPNKSQ